MKITTPILLLATLVVANAEPLINSWDTGMSGRYARLYETDAAQAAENAITTWNRGQGIQELPTYAGVSEVSVTDTDVYIRATGLGGHVMGPWYGNLERTNLFGKLPGEPSVDLPYPTRSGNATCDEEPAPGSGASGCSSMACRCMTRVTRSPTTLQPVLTRRHVQTMLRGMMFGTGMPISTRGVTFDAGNAHQAGSHYHYHANPPGLRHLLGDSVDLDPATNVYTENFNGQHSPILGWVRDGYPIYGPYGYSDPTDPESEVVQMRSGFRMRSITQRTTLPAHAARLQGYTPAGDTSEYDLPVTLFGPNVTAGFPSQYQLGHYIEDYEYLGDVGFTLGVDFDLNDNNGRFCVTPEFPQGTFAYFVNIEPDGTPKFPYNIGPTYYGNPQANTAAAIPAGAEVVFESGPEKGIEDGTLIADEANGDVTMVWSAVEGGVYVVEQTEDLQDWRSMTASMEKEFLVAPDPAALIEKKQQFYRADAPRCTALR